MTRSLNGLEQFINRGRLDFDFERICSVTLSQSNIYVCLTCGRYLQGRDINSPAHNHSLQEQHPLFINLETYKIYILPENEELIDDAKLNDIKYCILPTYSSGDLKILDEQFLESKDLHERNYVVGFLGINNIKCNDYANVCLQTILHIKPIRDLLLTFDFVSRNDSLLLNAISEAGRRIWNPRPFKALFSPHIFMQTVNLVSQRRYSLNSQADALEFLLWLLHQIHKDLYKIYNSDLIYKVFQGKVKVWTKKVNPNSMVGDLADGTFEEKVIPFINLTLDLPSTPLYQTTSGEYVTPQVSLSELLEKFDGNQLTHSNGMVQAFSLEKLPPFLIINYKRFTKSHLIFEKNRTIVNHPLASMKILDSSNNINLYDLIVNICHVGEAQLGKGQFKIQLLHLANFRWYEVHDLFVKEVPASSITLSESYIQIWKRQ